MKYHLNDARMFADVTEGTAIIINTETGVYYGMNPFGTAIYENLIEGVPSEDISYAINAMEGAPEDIRERVAAFVDELVAKEILLEGSDMDSVAEIDAHVAVSDSFEPVFREFTDAQDLILADPIHEVKEFEGWSPELSSLNEDKEDVARREAKMEK